jgi:phospholipase C
MAPGASAAALDGIHKIQHVVVIMQENRSFDQYFGTYPAGGLPRRQGRRPDGECGSLAISKNLSDDIRYLPDTHR